MRRPLSVTFSDIYMVKMENDVVIPSKSIFYRRFVDDIYSRRKLRDTVLFDRLNSYHPNIKLAIEGNPSKFLDTKLTNINQRLSEKHKTTSKTLKRYKRNTINGDLHRSKRKNLSDKRKVYEG